MHLYSSIRAVVNSEHIGDLSRAPDIVREARSESCFPLDCFCARCDIPTAQRLRADTVCI